MTRGAWDRTGPAALLLAVVIAVLAAAAAAQAPSPGSGPPDPRPDPRPGLRLSPAEPLPADLTFRRLAVPPAGRAPRITVRIDPEEQARLLANPPSVPPRPGGGTPPAEGEPAGAVPGPLPLGWFWEAVGIGMTVQPGRYGRAMAALAAPPAGQAAVPAPRLDRLRQIAEAHGATLLRASVGTRVSPALALAVIAVESGGDAGAVSRAGAQGLMQLIPATAARFGVSDPFDPSENITGGIAYLDWLLGTFDGDLVLALAGYNAGEGAVRRAGGVPPFAETRSYVPRVLAAWQMAGGLCRTPPELPGDGCVFVTGTTAAVPSPSDEAAADDG